MKIKILIGLLAVVGVIGVTQIAESPRAKMTVHVVGEDGNPMRTAILNGRVWRQRRVINRFLRLEIRGTLQLKTNNPYAPSTKTKPTFFECAL
jgi:hypothetical protein